MNDLADDLRYLGVYEKARQICRELGPEAAVRYVRSSYRLLSKVYHPDLHQTNRQAAEEGQKRLNSVKERLDGVLDDELVQALGLIRLEDTGGERRILVVDDEEKIRRNIADILELEGYRVAQAADGLRGLREHLIFKPELVITDVVMPVMDGVEMLRHMRERDQTLKAIFLSGFFGTSAVHSRLGEEITALGFPTLDKPFRFSDLLGLIRAAMG
ncbi:MAG: response regulator [Deltaproteobacteria bacterium]|nr:response regulator [Deltaproteobacteria bacterium]